MGARPDPVGVVHSGRTPGGASLCGAVTGGGSVTYRGSRPCRGRIAALGEPRCRRPAGERVRGMQDGPGRARVPDQPLVHVEIDDDGQVTVEGRVEPHARLVDGRALADLAVLAVARDHAGPLGRGVRVVARTPTEHSTMVVEPDGAVSELAPYLPSTPEGVAPAVRAHQWLDARDADRAREAATGAAHRARPVPRRRVWAGTAAAVATLGVAAAAVATLVPTGWTGGEATEQRPASASAASRTATPDPEPVRATEPPYVRTVVAATRLSALAVTGVTTEVAPGTLRVAVTATRRTPLTLVVDPVTAPGETRRLELTVRGATTRVVDVVDLAAGEYRWVVRVPGQRRSRGLAQVPAVPPPPPPIEVVPVLEAPAPVPPPAAPPAPARPSGSGGQGGGTRPSEPQPEETPTNEPYDPSTAPPTPCDPDDGC